ncbi:MAG: hypothetical protein IRZ08_10070 [Frankia sp.]|nr:hypothetical protein [Frankia sp.]
MSVAAAAPVPPSAGSGTAGQPAGAAASRAGAFAHTQPGEALLWAAAVAVLALLTGLLGAWDGTPPGAGLTGPDGSLASGVLGLRWPPRLAPVTLVAPAAAAAVLGLVGLASRRWAGRPAPPFPLLLAAAYLATLGWWLALGAAGPGGLAAPAGLLAAGRSTPGDILGAASAQPPGPALVVWALGQVGVRGGVAVGVALTALGAFVVPLVTLAVRSLCHAPAARRLLPVLALAPWGPFAAASPHALTAAVAAAAVAVGVVGCEPGRRGWWAFASGLLLAVAGLFSYPAVWLGVAVAAAYFVRRRPLLNVITGAGALAGMFAMELAGYSWPDGLSRAGGDLFDRDALAWVVPDLLVALVCAGPALARAAHRVSMTPGWPFLVGTGAAALFSLLVSLADGAVQSSWLALFPWLLVPALAPRPRPALPGDTSQAGQIPYLLVATGAVLAVAVNALLAR